MSKVKSWSELSSDPFRFSVAIEAHGPEHFDQHGISPLFVAAVRNKTELIKLLVKKKADLNGSTGGVEPPLAAASYHGAVESVETLIEAGADVNVQNTDGNTALMYAARKGYLEIVKTICEAGANIYIKDIYGRTAKDTAKLYERYDVVDFLTEWEQRIHTVGGYWECLKWSHGANC